MRSGTDAENAEAQRSTNPFVSNSTSVYVTNNNSVTVTNSTDVSGLSNLLAGISGKLEASTNLSGGGSLSNAIASKLSGSSTNWSSAETAANGIFDGIGVKTRIDSLAGAFAAPTVNSPGSADMTIQAFGTTLNLDPAVRFPALVNVSYYGFLMVAYLAFGLSVGKLFMETVRGFQSQQTGGVPDLEVSTALFGSNIAGVVVAILVGFVFVGGFGLLIFAISGLFLDNLLDSLHYSEFAAGLSGIGMYLLTTLLPLQTLLTLACTRITLHFTIGKLVLVAAGASRFLFGK